MGASPRPIDRVMPVPDHARDKGIVAAGIEDHEPQLACALNFLQDAA